MNKKASWQERYLTGFVPWDSGRHAFNLSEIVTKRRIKPCKALEVGCGTGNNAIWLARKGFSVTAVDVVDMAIQKAIKRVLKTRLRCSFLVADFMKQKIAGVPFGFAFDRGCFHSFDTAKKRAKYAKIMHSYLRKNGLWLTIVGSADGPPRDPGPPQRTARDIAMAVEPYFKILSLQASHLDSTMKNPPKAWVCLMQKRTA